MKSDTLCIHGPKNSHDTTGAVSTPIYQSATFSHPAVGESTGYDYSRLQNPTREQLEKIVANLEHGYDAMAFSTGMAATTALMELFSPGDHLITSNDLYGGVHRLFDHISTKNGLTFTAVDTANLSLVRDSITPSTKALYIETPSNPMMQVSDIKALSDIAKTHGLLLIVDNTFMTPYYQHPILLGADVIIHSGTKFLSGHNDTLSGFLVTSSADLSEKLRFIYKTTGACLAPFDCWLMIRGIKTLAIRMKQQSQNAMALATWLESQAKVTKVFYIGLPEHPSYDITKKQCEGFGSMISFYVEDEQVAKDILERVNLVLYAESLGGVETLITYPMLQTHADVPLEQRLAKGINEKLLRISVGLEDIDDIIKDLAQAMN